MQGPAVPLVGACIIAVWLLSMLTFTLPGRMSSQGLSSMDLLAIAKAVARVVFVCLFGISLFNRVIGGASSSSRLFLPWFALTAWSFLSVAWSPLKPFSLGQAIGLAALVLLSAEIGIGFSDRKSIERLLRHLSAALFVFTTIILLAYLVAPDLAGFDRLSKERGDQGLIHPTAAGAATSIAIVLLTITRMARFGHFSFPVTLVMATHQVTVLLLSSSRTAIAAAMITVSIAFVFFSDRRVLGRLAAGFALVVIVLLLVDPGFTSVERALSGGESYVRRGQSNQQISQLSGRTEMWTAVWDQFTKSPVIGHGYFVTSESGSLKVWGRARNHTAHHILLQMLASTGVIGAMLFLWAMVIDLRQDDLLPAR